MSRLWEEAIQKWYTDSHTSHLDYLNLAETTKPTKVYWEEAIQKLFKSLLPAPELRTVVGGSTGTNPRSPGACQRSSSELAK
ncbi:unnamed protein product [Musa acuminata subsp. malaccensis]|uniref:(wild Malaysian banana) hypothetical protein n=1 Tax=Musa acuminata subsp. malaccensis TaxID=214687 RepID=A0A804HM10_MUSAM|nr:unnamed protein product [Musa acuminata subsp. malaccensis]